MSICKRRETNRSPLDRCKRPEEQGSRKNGGVSICFVLTTLTCVLGSSFQFGFNIGVTNVPKEAIETYFKDNDAAITHVMWASIVGVFAPGGAFGALLGPLLADKYGRKRTLLANNITAFVAAVLMVMSFFVVSPMVLLVGRIVAGLNSGVNAVVSPCYVSEAAPLHLRGTLGVFNNLGITLGIFVSQVLGIKQIFGSVTLWPILVGFPILPALFQLTTLPFCPESPKFLYILKGDRLGARKALMMLRGKDNYSEDLEIVEREAKRMEKEQTFSIRELFKNAYLRRPLLIGIMMQFANQATGINAVVGYSTSIFKDAGITSSEIATCGLGFVTVLVPAVTYRMVEIKGRRKLLIFGLAGMATCYTILTLSLVIQRRHGITEARYISVVCVLLTMAVYQCGPAPIPWFIVGELFCQRGRGAAFSVAGFVNWMLTFAVLMGYPLLESAIGPYSFLVFAVFAVLLIILTYYYVPETKGKTSAEIMQFFKKKTCTDQKMIQEKRREKLTLRFFLTWMACFIGGSVSLGFNSGILVIPIKISSFWHSEDYWKGKQDRMLSMSLKYSLIIFGTGCLPGLYCGVKLASVLGRRKTMLISCLLGSFGTLIAFGISFTYNKAIGFLVSKIILGIASATGAIIAPLYLVEITPMPLRRITVSSHHIGFMMGILISHVYVLTSVSRQISLMTYSIGGSVILAFIGLVMSWFAVESPLYLATSKSEGSQVKRELYKLKGSAIDVDYEIAKLKVTECCSSHDVNRFLIWPMNVKGRWTRLLKISALQLINLFSCIGLIYAYYIDTSAGIFAVVSRRVVLGSVIVSFYCGTFLFMWVIKRRNEKLLLVVGLYGLAVIYLIFALSITYQYYFGSIWPQYLNLVCTSLIAVFHQLGPGPLSWLFSVKGSKSQCRSQSIVLAATAHLIMLLGLCIVIPLVQKLLHPFTYLLAAGICTGFLTYFIFNTQENDLIETIEERTVAKKYKQSNSGLINKLNDQKTTYTEKITTV